MLGSEIGCWLTSPGPEKRSHGSIRWSVAKIPYWASAMMRQKTDGYPATRPILADQQPISNIDIVTVAARIPRAVICLISALAFHEMTTQIPHAVSIALERGAEPPRIDYPPLTIHRFSGDSLTEGIQEHMVDGVTVRVYNPEKTLADCFRFRNQIGMDVVLEALKLYKARKPFNVGELLRYARVCRVEAIMKPYIEAML